jgi:hypothetical protein
MANKCGECQLFQGAGKCEAGKTTSSFNGMASTCSSFKAPASLFSSKKCGACRLFAGSGKCEAGKTTHSTNSMATSCSSYSPIPG